MRRVLLLITDLQLGGTPTIVRELAVRLTARGLYVEVACLAGWGAVVDQIRAHGITVTMLEARSPRDLRAIYRLRRLVRDGRFDVVYSHLVHANVAATLATTGLNVRLVHAIHTTQRYPRWHWWAQGVVATRADAVVAPTQAVAGKLRRRSAIPAGRLHVISNAIDASAFEQYDLPLRDYYPFPIGFLGRLDPVKRVPDLVEAVGMLDGLVELTIFGQGEDQDRVEHAIIENGAEDVVVLHGPVQRPQDALAGMGMLVLPSEAEGFGLVLIEAMAAGVPVVATDLPAVREIIRHRETGLLVPVGKPAALADAIRELVDDRELRVRLLTRARAEVAERFDWNRAIDQAIALL